MTLKLHAAVCVLLPMTMAVAQASPDQSPMKQKVRDAKPGDIRILATGSFLLPLQAVRNQLEARTGKQVIIEYGSARGNLKEMLIGGQPCEVSLLLPDVDQALVKEKKIDARTFKIAQIPVALAVKGNPPKLDVLTKEGIKNALLNASIVRYGPTGAALDTVNKILDTLNIRSSIKDANALQAPAGTASGLGPDEYEIGIFPLTDILANDSYRNLGVVIPEFQIPVVIEAGECLSTTDRAAADAVIAFLRSPDMEAALGSNGAQR